MPCELFVPWKPHAATLTVVEQANTIIDEYIGLGFNLTLRQLFYQFVARGLLKNLFNEYKRLGTIVRNARDAGLIGIAPARSITTLSGTAPATSSATMPKLIARICGPSNIIAQSCGSRKTL